MRNLLLLTVLFISLVYVTAKADMWVVLQKCTSYCNPEYCKISTVCRPVNRTSKFVSMDVYFHPGIALNAPINVNIVTLKKFATVYRPHMIKLKIEVCKQLSLMTHPILNLARDKSIAANMLHPCPISGHRYTKARITNLGDYDFPQVRFVPAGEWRTDVILSLEKNGSEVVVVSWSDYYEVKSIKAEEF